MNNKSVAEAVRERCIRACREIEKKKWRMLAEGGLMTGVSIIDCIAAIRALPLDDLAQTEGDENNGDYHSCISQTKSLPATAPQPSGDVVATWQQRCTWMSDEPATKLMVEAMKAEIADLRAALAKVQEGQP